MNNFAISTGLTDYTRDSRRYLWTDAFAVCNYLELYRQTNDPIFMQLAIKLVEQVHQTLGRHRIDSEQKGWISGLDEEQGLQHPTRGGLRIGKKLNEPKQNDPIDETLQWDQDGQYFHYLTKWMHALNRVSHVTGDSKYNHWAIELAKVAFSSFTYTPATTTASSNTPINGKRCMYWKMSIDLSRSLVNSMGHHDPLDGYITFLQLESSANQFSKKPQALRLTTEIESFACMCLNREWSTQDPLGIGGLLTDAYKLAQLIDTYHLHESTRLEILLDDIKLSLQSYIANNQLNLPVDYRLAFRELGLAIGLHALSRMQKIIEHHPDHFSNSDRLIFLIAKLYPFKQIHKIIEEFWLEKNHQSVKSWHDHMDINNVMLATELLPDGFLRI